MTNDDRKRIRRKMRNAVSRITQGLDQRLTDFRFFWESWSDEDRASFKEWIGEAAELRKTTPRVIPHITLKIELSERIADDEYREFFLPIEAMRRAVEYWERGEEFVPRSMDEMSS